MILRERAGETATAIQALEALFDKVGGKPRTIPAFYYEPRTKDGAKAPVVIQIHGGPESQSRPVFSADIQFLVGELGVAVLVPNVRGSAGYGKRYLQLDNGFKREDSVEDIGALLDWIDTRSELDAKRVGVYGGSYGGYMVLASMTHYDDRLRAGIDVVGISNFLTFLEHTESYRRDLRRVESGSAGRDGQPPDGAKRGQRLAPEQQPALAALGQQHPVLRLVRPALPRQAGQVEAQRARARLRQDGELGIGALLAV